MRKFVGFLAAFSLLCIAGRGLAQEERKAGQLVSLEVVFADVGPAAGAGELTAAKILDLDKQGKLAAASRIKLSVLENVPGSVQFGAMAPVVTGREFSGRGGGVPSYARQNIGTTVQATARVEADGTIVVELTAERSQVAAAKAAADAEADARTMPEPQSISQSTLRTTVRAISGQPVIIGGQAATAGQDSAHTYVVLTASAAKPAKDDGAKAAATPRGSIKVFSLTRAKASELLKALRPILGDQPIVLAADDRTNSILASGTQEQLETAAALIQKLDES